MAAGKQGGKRPAKQRDPEEALLHVLRHPLRWGRAALGMEAR